ncbi:MAG TPA: glycosyltransferase [Chitinophagaceae bacterium]|nr:glycosyltransferase [Chitinophagaceae bacterium]
MVKFSIILPVRNGGNYIKECVNSILSQSHDDFNLLVLDNASTDGTLQWLASLDDSRIKFFPSEKPLTIEENWARILTIPKNEFITLIGHDDLLDRNYLSVMDALIKKHPDASLYQAHFRYIDAAGNFKRHCKIMDEIQFSHEFIAHQFLQSLDSMGTGYMMRSKDFEAAGGLRSYPKLIFSDYELWVRLINKNYKATALDECFSYREHDSTSKLVDGDEYQQAFERYIFFLKEMMDEEYNIKTVIHHYGGKFLLDFCESLSHRLLKTPYARRKITVNRFINKCKGYASMLIPGEAFDPDEIFRIKIADYIDRSALGRFLFYVVKRRSFK